MDGIIERKKGNVFNCSVLQPSGVITDFISFLPNSSGAQAANKMVVCVHNSRFPRMSPEISLEVAVMRERALMDFIWLTQDILGF